MEQIGLIFLKTNVAIAIFTVFYWLFLRKFTFYNINRLYLLFTVVFSFVYPFIEISAIQNKKLAVIPEMMPVIVSHTGNFFSGMVFTTLMILWLLGSLYFLTKLIIQFYSLRRIHRLSLPSIEDNTIRLTGEEVSPFSFGSYIYVNPSMHTTDELDAILLHEQIHVRQKHSVDILATELLMLLNWFNPFTWLLRKSVKDNIEFITDNEVLRNGVDKKEYQYHLLNTTCNTQVLRLQNNFSIADLKKRIMQMNMQKTARAKLLMYSLIPMLAGFLLLFNQPVQRLAMGFLSTQEQNSNARNLTENTDIQELTINVLPPPPPEEPVDKKQSSGKENTITASSENVYRYVSNVEGELPPPPPPRPAETSERKIYIGRELTKGEIEKAISGKGREPILVKGYELKTGEAPLTQNNKFENNAPGVIKIVQGLQLDGNKDKEEAKVEEVIVVGRKSQP